MLAFTLTAPTTSRTTPPSPSQVAKPLSQRLAKLAETHKYSNGRLLIGLVGVPGCGKSTIGTFATQDSGSPLVQMDGFHIPLANLNKEGLERRGAPFTFDQIEFVNCLTKIRQGEIVRIPKFDHAKKDPVLDDRPISSSSRICLVEGNYLLHWPKVRELLFETWFVDIDLETAMSRVLRRLVRDVGYDLETAKLRVLQNDAINAKLILESRKFADFAVNPSTGAVTAVRDGSKVAF